MSYLAFVLDEQSRADILTRTFPPQHPDVICHHVTMIFGITKEQDSIALDLVPQIDSVFVVGQISDDKGEALIVSINGFTTRLDGGTYHITLSIDRDQGVKPVYSNQLIKEKGWIEVDPFEITGSIQLLN